MSSRLAIAIKSSGRAACLFGAAALCFFTGTALAQETQETERSIPEFRSMEVPVLPGLDVDPSAAELQNPENIDEALPDFFQEGNAGGPSQSSQNFDFEQPEEDVEEQTRREAFDAALKGLLPLRPEEIRTLLEKFDRTKEAVEIPVYPNPKPEVAIETLSLDPGTTPATIFVASGHVTTLNILDITGAPWPIQDVSWAGNFDVTESGSGEGSHIISISPQSEFAYGNMSIRLLTLKTPVILTLQTSRDKVHYRFDAVIPAHGPMAEAPLIETGLTIAAGDESLSAVLRGVPGPSAEKLSVSGVDGRTSAYRLNGKTYVRTPLTLLSPNWESSVSSADGMRVYALQNVPVLLLSDKGKMVRARLSVREEDPFK